MEKKLRIHGFTCLYIQVQPSHAREPNTQLAHLLYILWDGMSSPGPTHHSKRCPFLPGVVSKRPILSLPPPLPTPPRIYMHKLDICHTYIYICRFTPPTLLPRQGHATPGQRTAPGPTAAAGGPRGAGGPRSPTSSSQTTRARNPQDWAPAGTAPRPTPPLPETPAKGQRQQKKAKLTNSSFFKSTSHANLAFFWCSTFPLHKNMQVGNDPKPLHRKKAKLACEVDLQKA